MFLSIKSDQELIVIKPKLGQVSLHETKIDILAKQGWMFQFSISYSSRVVKCTLQCCILLFKNSVLNIQSHLTEIHSCPWWSYSISNQLKCIILGLHLMRWQGNSLYPLNGLIEKRSPFSFAFSRQISQLDRGAVRPIHGFGGAMTAECQWTNSPCGVWPPLALCNHHPCGVSLF